MTIKEHLATLNGAMTRFGGLIAVGAAAAGLALATPAYAHDSHHFLNFDNYDDQDLLEDLIEMDAEDIQEMREEFAEARAEIKDAIGDIDEAREEASSAPGGAVIVKAAFAAARITASAAVDKALREAREEIDDAEVELAAMDISADERVETQEAIDVLRTELAALEDALGELFDALSA